MILSKYRVGIGSLVLGTSDDDTGASWVVEDLKGWQSTSSTGTVTQRSAARGGWRNRAQLGSKGYTLEGSVYTDRGNAPDLLDDLLAAIALDVPEVMTIYGVHASGDRVTFVRQEGDAIAKVVSPSEGVFSIGLVAPDPLNFSTDEHIASTKLPVTVGGLTVPVTVPFSIDAAQVSGVVAVRNDGNYAIGPRVVIYGPVEVPKVTHLGTGESLQLNMDLEVGEWMDIDFDRHTAMLNGVSSRRGYISGKWFVLTPGDNTIAFNSPNYATDAEIQVIWRDAWK